MDTRLLRTFTTLARIGGFTATAAELSLAQSTVTVHIRALERELGVRLVDRLPSGARLTDAGGRLLVEAEAMLEAEARLRATALAERGSGEATTGRVVLGAGESLCASRVPPAVAALRREHPGIDLQLHPASTAGALEGLRAGRLDLALLLEHEVNEPDLTTRRISREPLAYVVAPDHPLAGRAPSWRELADHDVFVHEEGCSYSDELVRSLTALPEARPRLTRLGSIAAARALVEAGLGLTLLPRATVADGLRNGTLAEVDGPRFPPVPVRLARHTRRWVSPATHTVATVLTHLIPA